MFGGLVKCDLKEAYVVDDGLFFFSVFRSAVFFILSILHNICMLYGWRLSRCVRYKCCLYCYCTYELMIMMVLPIIYVCVFAAKLTHRFHLFIEMVIWSICCFYYYCYYYFEKRCICVCIFLLASMALGMLLIFFFSFYRCWIFNDFIFSAQL